MSFETIVQEIREMTIEERKRLISIIVDTLTEASGEEHSLLELEGRGKEIWEGIDAQEYVNQLRSEWDNRFEN